MTAWGTGNALFVASGCVARGRVPACLKFRTSPLSSLPRRDTAPIAVQHEKIQACKLVHSVDISEDGKLVAALADKTIIVVEVATGTVLGTACVSLTPSDVAPPCTPPHHHAV